MSTFLQLCSQLRQDCGISGTGPSTVVAQAGELARVVSWTKQAYTDLQSKKPNWRWLHSKFTVNTVSGTDSYAYTTCTDTIASATITRFKRWYPTEFEIYLTSAGVATSHWINYQPWDLFKRQWKVGQPSNSYPTSVTIDPQNNIVLGPPPDGIYTLTGDYQKSAQVLAADSDVPEMPADFHQLIVYLAMRKYAAYSNAPEVWQEARAEASRLLRALELDQLDLPTFGRPLA